MVKVVYPDGHVTTFMWLSGGYGYIRHGKRVLRYPLPKKKRNGRETVVSVQ